MSAIHAYRARKTFISSILQGEAAANLAQAAMAVAAEDDAIGTSVEQTVNDLLRLPMPQASQPRVQLLAQRR